MARRYPRFAEPLAPKALRPVLNMPFRSARAKGGYSKLRDLDAGVWRTYSEDQCIELGNEVVEAVRQAVAALPTRIAGRKMPGLPRGYKFDDLNLDTRTWNCLDRAGLLEVPSTLRQWSIEEILEIRSFGARTLVDLLSALEATRSRAQLGLNEELTYQLEKAFRVAGNQGLTADDPRLAPLLSAIDGRATDVDRLITRLLTRDRDPRDPEFVAEAVRKLRLGVRKLKRLSLEDELHSLVEAVVANYTEMIVRVLGFDGKGGTTLQIAGDEYGITRERVRQVVKKATSRLEQRDVFCPRLDDALAIVEESVPCDSDAAARLLNESDVTRTPFDVRGLIRAAELFGREPNFEMVASPGGRALVPPGEGDVASMLVSEAKRRISSQGVASVADVAQRVGSRADSDIPEDFASAVLTKVDGFSWLDEDGGWFWLRSVPRNRLLNLVDKAMSVAQSLDVSELRRAVSRDYRMKGFAPPSRVLLELCRQVERFVVEDRTVRDEPPLDYEEILEGTEETLARIFFEHGPLLTSVSGLRNCWFPSG